MTPKPTARAPRLTENGKRVNGLEAANLGRAKSVVLAVDRSQSMQGQALLDASRAARAFVRKKPGSDRIAIVAVGKRAVQLTGFSSSTIDVDAALRGIEVDTVQGTALYDAIVLSSEALGAETLASRVLILLTDGQEVSSEASLAGRDRRRSQGGRDRVSHRDRERQLLARAAEEARQGDRRALHRRSRLGLARRRLQLDCRRAAADVATHVHDLRASGRGDPARRSRRLADEHDPRPLCRRRAGRPGASQRILRDRARC